MAVEQEPPELGPLRDNSILWRISLWGGAATVAMAAAVLMTQTDIGAQRLQMVMRSEPAPKPITQADFVPRAETDTLRRETLRLESQVRELAADRDKLNARIAALETSLSDMTGSIKRELAAVAAKPVAVPVAPPATQAPVISAPPTAPPARLQPLDPEPTREPGLDTVAKTGVQPQAAPPLGEPVPLPPMRVASASTGEIGVDLGGARSLDIMQARWAAVKANFGPLLTGLNPLVARDPRPNMIPYRLIVGPLPNAAAAAQVCARFAASKVTCRTTKFAGEQLTMQQ
ncbi:MAG: hypothetical protein Q8M24_01250 [Pseudolabrys sp.]|nr:hypothetical protein [Pseudolabrys sp.]MDP2294071.1 hypothetical protein [Pseudolabrys sp.]